MKRRYFRILALDGGGIRGMLPAMFVAELERRLRLVTGKADSYISDYFDLIAGTSTGGILACYYLYNDEGVRLDAEQAVQLYERQGGMIFHKRLLRFFIRLFDSLYPVKGIERALLTSLGNARLSTAPCNSAVMAYDIAERKAVIFTRDAARLDPRRDYLLRDVARATSAAPTFFRVAKVVSLANEPAYLIDGGIYANDPAICAIVEAKKTMLPDDNSYPKISDMYVLSLGCGKVAKSYSYERAKRWGVFSWAIPVIDMLQSSSAEVVSYQADKLFDSEHCRSQYVRLVPDLDGVSHKMDDASPRNIARLKTAGQRFIEANSACLDNIVANLLA
jgi:patatin-like phospholipase/acyl hydrolase